VNTVTDKGDKWIADSAVGYAGSNGPKIIVEKENRPQVRTRQRKGHKSEGISEISHEEIQAIAAANFAALTIFFSF
jgi:hypothetical protein